MANKIYYSKTTLIGGAATALDYIDGSLLVDGDFAYVTVAGVVYCYKLNASSGAAEASPNIISPDTNAGNKRWILQKSGSVLQVVNYQTGVVANTNTTIPGDDTIPQNTEGYEIMTLAITPIFATSKLMIDVSAFFKSNGAEMLTLALFQDTTANALAAVQEGADNGIYGRIINLRHYMTAGTVSATTFKVRIGGSNSGVITFNGYNTGRFFGGVAASSITITELIG